MLFLEWLPNSFPDIGEPVWHLTLIESSGLRKLLPVLLLQVRIVRVLHKPLLENLSLLCGEILLLASMLLLDFSFLFHILLVSGIIALFVLLVNVTFLGEDLVRRLGVRWPLDLLPALAGLGNELTLLILQLSGSLDESGPPFMFVKWGANLLTVIGDDCTVFLTRASEVIETGVLILRLEHIQWRLRVSWRLVEVESTGVAVPLGDLTERLLAGFFWVCHYG